MTLDPDDLELVRQIADYDAFLSSPRGDTVGDVMRRMIGVRADLARMEAQLLNRALKAAGLPLRPQWTCEPFAEVVYPPREPGGRQ